MKRRTYKEWDAPIMAGFPVGLYMQTVGASRAERRASREHKNDPTPPGSMVPAVLKITWVSDDATGDSRMEKSYVAAW